MVQDDHDLEDVDTDSDDHAIDALRYMLQGGLRPSAPRLRTAPVVPYSLAWFRQRFNAEPSGVLA
jgi:hypothetical protein